MPDPCGVLGGFGRRRSTGRSTGWSRCRSGATLQMVGIIMNIIRTACRTLSTGISATAGTFVRAIVVLGRADTSRGSSTLIRDQRRITGHSDRIGRR